MGDGCVVAMEQFLDALPPDVQIIMSTREEIQG